MTQQIGILFWGCKGGHRNFCDNGVVDVYSTEIRQTYKDVRSFATFSVVNTDFYALEFTSDYKVYTHYRSSNDSGSGAFIALTIYVPNSLKVKDIRQIMDKMMDEYFAEYFNPITNSPIPGMMEDIAPFQQMFDDFVPGHVLPDKSRFFKRPSLQDDTPKVLAYSSFDELDAYFASPYRPEFYGCQEVMFISKDILQNPSEYGLRFQVQPSFIEHVSDPEPEPLINLFPSSVIFTLTQFKINGVDHTARQGDAPLYPGDRITMRIEGNKYQRPIVVENASLEEVIQRGLIKKTARGYEFLPVYNLDYAEFKVLAHIDGDNIGSCYRCFALRSLDDPGLIIPGTQLDPKSGMFVFVVNGKHLNHRFQLIYSVLPSFAAPTLIIPLNEVDLEMLITQGHTLQVGVQRHVLNFLLGDVAPKSIQFAITSTDRTRTIQGSINDPGSSLELCLPSNFTFTAEGVQLYAKDFTIKLDSRGRYQINPQWIDVEVLWPRQLLGFDVTRYIPSYKIGDQTYNGFWHQQKCYLRLPYEWTQLSGNLIIDGNSFQSQEISPSKITFKCALVSNRTDRTLGYEVIFEDGLIQRHKLLPNGHAIFPATVDVRISPQFSEIGTVEEQGFTTDNKTKLFLLESRHLEPSSPRQGFDIDENIEQNTSSTEGSATKDQLTQGRNSESNSNDEGQDQRQQPAYQPTVEEESRPHPGDFTKPSDKNRGSNGTHTQGTKRGASGRNSSGINNRAARGQNRNQNDDADSNSNSVSTSSNPSAVNSRSVGSGISSVNSANATSENEGPNRTSETTNTSKPTYYVRLENCDGFKCRIQLEDNSYRVEAIASLDTSDYIKVNPERPQIKILDSRERGVCIVNFPKSEYLRDTVQHQRNTENGFNVYWVDDNHCIVSYKKNNFFSKLRNSFIANKKLFGGVISILIIALVTACWIFIGRTSEDYRMDLQFEVNKKSKSSGTENMIVAVGYKGLEYNGDSICISNNGDILNGKSEVNPWAPPSTGGELSEVYVVYNKQKPIPILKDNNSYANISNSLVIYPEDIQVINSEGEAVKDSLSEAKDWTMDSVLFLLSSPKKIERNLKLILSLPPISFLLAFQRLRALDQIDNERIDSLIKVYPQYEARIVTLKEPTLSETHPQEPSDNNDESEENSSEENTNDSNVGSTQGNDKQTQTNKSVNETPSQNAQPAVGSDPNAEVITEYHKKMAQLDGVFSKEMVNEIINFREKNRKKLGRDVIMKYKYKLNAYYNFVSKEPFDTTMFTPTQQAAIKRVKVLFPSIVESRNYPEIYNAYVEAGGR